MKTCTKCGVEKPATTEMFAKNSRKKDGLQCHCKVCQAEYRSTHKKEILETSREYYKNNKDEILKRGKESKKRRYNKARVTSKAYEERNKEKILQYQKEYRIKNKENIARKARLKEKEDLKNPLYRLKKNLRRRLSLAINGQCKSASTMELIGCTIEELRTHLENQFTEGMSWDNYSLTGWHVDHIIPCKAYQLENPEQQKQCFHYTNLQPLWASDNYAKSGKY